MAILGTANPDTLLGTAFADIIEGLAGDDAIYGYDAADLLDGGDGDDFLFGGSGDDTLIGGAGEDFFYGQSGIDTASYATATSGLTLNLVDTFLSTGDAYGDFFFSVERFVLGGLADVFLGSLAANIALGGAGNDTLSGLGGNDQLQGDGGDDLLIGGAGADSLTGGGGTDIASYETSAEGVTFRLDTGTFSGEAEGDTFTGIEGVAGSAFADSIHLGGSFRLAYGGRGADGITGSAFNDRLEGGFGADQLFGGLGNDEMFGGDDEVIGDGDLQANFLRGLDGNDSLFGGNTFDTLLGDAGNDVLNGGGNQDTLNGGAGADVLNGGDGIDTAVYDTTVKLNLATPASSTGAAKGDSFASIEALTFTATGSSYVGGAAAFSVTSTASNFSATAGTGAESFSGTNYRLSYAAMAASVTLTATEFGLEGSGAAAGDEILGSVSVLTLTGFGDTFDLFEYDGFGPTPASILSGNGADTLAIYRVSSISLDAGTGNDTVTGNVGIINLTAGAGNDHVSLTGDGPGNIADATLSGGSGNDDLELGGFGSVQIDAGTGNDLVAVTGDGLGYVAISGGEGEDTISAAGTFLDINAGAGDDQVEASLLCKTGSVVWLKGGDGNDVLEFEILGSDGFPALGIVEGGAGNDAMVAVGTAGSFIQTTFVFADTWGDDTITGFLDGTDLLEFTGPGVTSFEDLVATSAEGGTLVSVGTETILLIGLDISDFSASDVLIS